MRIPIRHIAGHLVWGQGGVWAVWRLAPLAGRYAPAAVREEMHASITSLVRSLSGAPRLIGLCAQVDPGEVVERMVDDVDLDAHPAWAQTAEAGLDLLEGQEMHRRTLWLAVPLAPTGRRLNLSAAFGTIAADVTSALGLAPPPVARTEVVAYQQQAARVAADLGGGLSLREATPAEIVWMIQHTVHRGLAEPLLAHAERSPLYGGRLHGQELHSPSYADLGQVRLAEGGQPGAGNPAPDAVAGTDAEGTAAAGRRKSTHPGKPWWRAGATSPLMRRWLQVECEGGTGYQAHLAVAELPPAIAPQAADWLAQLEALEFPVDFVVDMHLVAADKARQQIQRKKTELVDQADQYDVRPTGMPASLTAAAGDLGEMDARLARTGVEVEVQSVTVLTVWGPDPVVCDARARALSALLAGGDYRTVRPQGMQEELIALGLPGAARPPAVREFTQHQLSEDWALNGAFADTALGDPTGMFLGLDLDCGTTRPVLLNIADAPQQHASASVGIVGDLGAGKSVVEKLLTAAVVDRGGRGIVIDRTPLREWSAFAERAAAGRCQVIDAAAAQVSIDPLRVFTGPIAAHYAMSYLTLQLGVGPMSTAGAVLHRAVQEAAAAPQPSMQLVAAALREMARSATATRQDAAATMGELLQIVADNPLAAAIFDDRLPPVTPDGDLGSDLVVITTAGLTLPPREAVGDPEVLRQQPLEALIGRAALYLIAAIARQAAFTEPGRFTAVVMDECYWLTSSAEGLALVHEIVHDGRKHGAGVILGAHDADELGDDRGLLAYKLLGRTTDTAMAAKGLAYLGLDSTDEDLVRLVTTGLSPVGVAGREGEMLLRDPRMHVGRVKVVISAVARLADRIFTTPGAAASPRDDGAETSAREAVGGAVEMAKAALEPGGRR